MKRKGNKNKKALRVLLIVLLCVLLSGGAVFAAVTLRSGGGKKVGVIPVEELSDSWWGEDLQSEGIVRAENLQTVYLSETQHVREIYVKEGQQVKKGDRLLAYDSTLSELELQRLGISVQKKELELTAAQKDLAALEAMRPYTPTAQPEKEQSASKQDAPAPVFDTLPHLLSGDGSAAAPYRILWDESCTLDDAFVRGLTSSPTEEAGTEDPDAGSEAAESGPAPEAPSGAGEALYLILETRENASPAGALLQAVGLCCTENEAGGYDYSFFTPDLPEEPDGEHEGQDLPDPPEPDEGYSAAALAKMKAEKAAEIRDLKLMLRMEKLKLARAQAERDGDVVTAAADGTVKTVTEEAEARQNGAPVLRVSNGGSYYVQSAVSETQLGQVKPGDKVTIESWMSDTPAEYAGTVAEISTYPQTNGEIGVYTEGNPNVSFYPVTIRVEEDAALGNGDYVSVTFPAAEEQSPSVWLNAAFIVYESGKSYVWAADENGLLEKREIGIGRIMWGDTVEVRQGLSEADAIAFPYGKYVRSGAKTEQVGAESLM